MPAEPDTTSTPSAATVQSVDRAVRLLQLVAEHGEVGVGELAAQLGVHKSTTSRLLATLLQHGLVQQDGPRGSYRLGYGLVELAGSLAGGDDLRTVARPVAVDLATSVGETVNLVVLDGADTLCIDQVIGGSAVTTVNWIGKRAPAHATASGKVILAGLATDELAQLLPGSLEALTPRTITDHARLRSGLAHARERGWASSVDEQEEGLSSVAAPVRVPGGQVVAALTVSAPSFRITDDLLAELGAAAAAAAGHVSRRTVLLPHT